VYVLHWARSHEGKKPERASPKALLVTSMSHMPENIFMAATDNVVFVTFPFCFTVSTQHISFYGWVFFF